MPWAGHIVVSIVYAIGLSGIGLALWAGVGAAARVGPPQPTQKTEAYNFFGKRRLRQSAFLIPASKYQPFVNRISSRPKEPLLE
jgi:hypothetical protein